jgi:hypothetical protein
VGTGVPAANVLVLVDDDDRHDFDYHVQHDDHDG